MAGTHEASLMSVGRITAQQPKGAVGKASPIQEEGELRPPKDARQRVVEGSKQPALRVRGRGCGDQRRACLRGCVLRPCGRLPSQARAGQPPASRASTKAVFWCRRPHGLLRELVWQRDYRPEHNGSKATTK